MGKCLIFNGRMFSLVVTRFKGVWGSAGQSLTRKNSDYLLHNSWGRDFIFLCIYSCILFAVDSYTLCSSLCEQGSISEPGLGLLSWWTNS